MLTDYSYKVGRNFEETSWTLLTSIYENTQNSYQFITYGQIIPEYW